MTTRTALVGGASSGIGRAAAEALAADGFRLAITGRDAESLMLAAKELAARGTEVEPVVADLADPDSASAVVDRVADRFGPVDALVVNAGGPPPGRVLDVTDEQWRDAAELLLLGPLRLARLVLPVMAGRGFGRVVVVTSNAVRQPQAGLAVSSVLRAAVTTAAKLMAAEHADRGVTVNCVAPGATATGRMREVLTARASASGSAYDEVLAAEVAAVPAGRPADPREVADVIAFLVSERASFVNGTVVTVDGGRTETP